MSDVRLVGLDIRDMGPWVGEHTLDLPDPGLYLVLGEVSESGGGSGAGKSYLLNSIPFVFGGCPFSGTDLQSWYTEDAPYAGGRLLVDGVAHKAWRDSKGLFYQQGEEKPLKGKAAAPAIDKLLGMGPELRAQATFLAQGESAGFLGLKPADKMSFLSTVLGLEEAELGAERLVKEASAALKKLEAAKGAVKACQDAVDRARTALKAIPAVDDHEGEESRLTEAEAAMVKARETELVATKEAEEASKKHTADVVAARAAESAITREIEKLQRESYEPPTEVSEAIKKAMDEVSRVNAEIRKRTEARTAEIASLNRALAEPTGIAARESGAIETGKKAAAQIKLLEQQTCPTCERQWTDTSALVTLAAEKATVEKAKDTVRKARAAAKLVAEIREKIRVLSEVPVEQISSTSPELEALRGEMQVATWSWMGERDAKVTALKGRRGEIHHPPPFGTSQDLIDARTAVRSAEKAVETCRLNLQKLEGNLLARQSAEKVEAEARQALMEAQAEMMALTDEAAARADGSDMLRAFSVGYAEEALGAIAERANAALGAVPNVAHVSISFSVERETASGSVVKRIEPRIRTRGREVSFTSGISGGMQTPIRRAVDLAIGEVAAARGGTYPGWLVLDEALNGLGAVEKSACLGVLSEFASKRTILVVDHDATFQGLFSRIITVRQENGRSSLV